MNWTAYLLQVSSAFICGIVMTVLFAYRRKSGITAVGAVMLLVLSGVLAFGAAYGGYTALQFMEYRSQFPYCLTTGLLGMMLGAYLTERLTKMKKGTLMDAMAPAMCLTMAMARASQVNLGSVGLGWGLEEGDLLACFPFASVNSWNEWNLNVCILEGMACLVIMVISAGWFLREKRPAGVAAARTLAWLMIVQILMEQLRSVYMQWRMVRVEQVVCAIIVLLVLVRHCRVWQKESFPYRVYTGSVVSNRSGWWPVPAFLICVLLVVAAEFALDGKISISNQAAWVIYAVAMVAMLLIEIIAVKRIPTETKEN